MLDAFLLAQDCPHRTCGLRTPVGREDNPKAGYPEANDGVGAGLSGRRDQGFGLRLPGSPVQDGEETGVIRALNF